MQQGRTPTSRPEGLFKYTSGRWLIDEEHQLAQRYVKFHVNNLCSKAASVFSDSTTCMDIIKIEGNFNKAFLLTMDDGHEVVAKVPCPNAGPPSLTTASEVATLNFLQSRTSIPVPVVFAWSPDPANPVGAEHIIMEKVPGVALGEKWDSMNMLERFEIITQIIQMESELRSMVLSAYGSLYLRDSQHSLPRDFQYHPLPADLDPDGSFCVGPSCHRTAWDGISGTPDEKKYTGPCEVQEHLNRFGRVQSIDEYISLLHKIIKILPILSSNPEVLDVSPPVLWHTDLHLHNIFVAPDNPTTIQGIIDWQSTRSAPLFTQARFPEFLRPPKNYIPGARVPRLPDDFEGLSPEQKEEAKRDNTLASLSKYYELACRGSNEPAYNGMSLDRRLWEPFTPCSLPDCGSLVPLRNALIRLSRGWDNLVLPGVCPFGFTERELERHAEQEEQYSDMLYLWDTVKTGLCTDDTGWVPNDRWDATNEVNRDLFNMYIETMSEEMTPEEAAAMWPFPPVPVTQ
ncbi:phosphotransferase family protein [Aspergillus pseudonomiae]|uniref:Altered inheritance of mitochondria protein 9, mitochondrial n=1 Tax=Aspergillus pseudonomiae TaxID=1506151 RepID=A0A5N7DM57_9EURO|nr:phosphotransferase family protein [Aspergillus pseudonomiae]KAE8407474.1 phosphotransferase family protein [Aspergillus pseudonomiae]